MERHVVILGWLHICCSLFLVVIAGLVFMLLSGIGVFAGIAEGDWEALPILSIVALFVVALMSVLAAPGIIGGVGLLKRQRWARVLVIIIGIFDLLNPPIGTAIGIYTLWVLMSHETDYVFSPYYAE